MPDEDYPGKQDRGCVEGTRVGGRAPSKKGNASQVRNGWRGAETHIEIDLEGSLSVLWWAGAGTGASSNGKECQMKKCNLQPQCLTE